MLLTRFASVALFLTLALSSSGADSFYLKNGDRVVFYGDSITDQRLYTVIAETYVVTRFPNLDIKFVHSGWGGDKVSGGGGGPVDLRLSRDVLAYKPTVLTIMLGMNDGLYRPETEATDRAYFDGYKHIVDTVKAADPGVRITAIEPSPYDDVTREPLFPGGYNEVLLSFSKWISSYAAQAGLDVADLNAPVIAMLRRANELDPVMAQTIIKDRVHPSFSGHLVMAEALLKAWHAPALVSSVAIQAGSKPKLIASEHAAVTDLSSNAGLSWTETEDALPLPLPEWQQNTSFGPVALVLRSSDLVQALNGELLQVSGLPSGVYTLKIDGSSIANFNNDELARGVNLALRETPMTKQAKEVYDLTVAHCNVHNDRWRTVEVPLAAYGFPAVQPAMRSADDLESAILQKRREAAQPHTHKFNLVPAA